MDDGIVVALCAMRLSSVLVHSFDGLPTSSMDHSLSMEKQQTARATYRI